MEKKVTYSSRLREVRESLGLSQRDMYEKLGYSNSQWSMVETGQRPLSRKLLDLLFKFYKISPNYLLQGYGPMFTDNIALAWAIPPVQINGEEWHPGMEESLSIKDEETKANPNLKPQPKPQPKPNVHLQKIVQVAEDEEVSAKSNLTFLPVRAQAGYLLATGGQTVMENEVERVYWPDLGRGEYFAFEVWGDSMEPSLQAGDYVIGQKIENVRALLNYEPYVLVYGDMVLVKRILKKSAAILQLISDNPAYPPEDIRWEELTQCYRVHRLLSRRIPNLSYVRTLEAKVLALESRLKGD